MSIFNFEDMQSFGCVQSVDTATVVVNVTNVALLSKLQVNHLVAIRAAKAGQVLIGMVNKIMRKFGTLPIDREDTETISNDIVKATLIGTFLDRDGTRQNVFKRTLESVPEIDSDCFLMTDTVLTAFMSVISGAESGIDNPLCIGRYM